MTPYCLIRGKYPDHFHYENKKGFDNGFNVKFLKAYLSSKKYRPNGKTRGPDTIQKY